MTVSDTGYIPKRKAGAPVRFLILFASCWILARILWEIYPAARPPPGFLPLAQIVSDGADKSFADFSNMKGRSQVEKVYAKAPHSEKSARFTSIFLEMRAYHNLLRIPVFKHKPVHEVAVQDARLTAYAVVPERDIYAERVAIAAPRYAQNIAVKQSSVKQSSAISGYFWIYARQNGSQSTGAINLPSGPTALYGGSQAGAILSYRLRDSRKFKTWLYGRVTTNLTLQKPSFAAGVRVQPDENIPVSLHIEKRAGSPENGGDGAAIFAAGGFGPRDIAPDIRVSGYGQVGYIAAANESYFFDLSATLEKTILEKSGHRIELGAGIWSGGQENITRVDAGPRLAVTTPVTAKHDIKVAIDWRQRLAGNAAPDSGLALTVTSGF